MIENEKRTFYELLVLADSLPTYVSKLALERIVLEWSKKNTFVKAVMKGETTFKTFITPLLGENMDVGFFCDGTVCNTKLFKEISEKCRVSFKGILHLDDTRSYSSEVDLTETINVSLLLWQELFKVLLFGIVTLLFVVIWMNVGTKESFDYVFYSGVIGVAIFALRCMYRMFWQLPRHLSKRRKFAHRVLAQVEYLDEKILEVRKRFQIRKG